jgi:hypothetical protein
MREGTVTLCAEELAKKSKGSVVQTLPCFWGNSRIAADQVRQVKSEVRIQNAKVKPRATCRYASATGLSLLAFDF